MTGRNPDLLHAEVSVALDTRDYAGHPNAGSLYRIAAGSYMNGERAAGSFRLYQAEGMQIVPLLNGAWTIALHGWTVLSDTSSDGDIPFYLTPSLGGANTIRGFPDYRFHDRHLLLGTAESRWPLFQHVEVGIFVDSGAVARRIPDLGFDSTTFGCGVRVHSHSATTARIDIAHGAEGWQVLFRVDDPFRLARITRWPTAVPFVP
jgi:outer membrane protein assembly factor BamA